MRINKIILYDEPTVPEIKLKEQRDFLSNTFHIEVVTRKNFLEKADDIVFERIKNTRIWDLKQPFEKQIDVQKNVEYEKESLQKEKMIFYDGFEMQKIIAETLPAVENNRNTLHIIFTNKITCTFDKDDFRYHARPIIGSNPTIISTSGMVEGPARSKQYYLDIMTSFSQEETEKFTDKYKNKFLEYNDARISEISEGYILQSIIYFETGEIFCNDKSCRLFNSHWQEELLFTQVKNKKFCKRHFEIFSKLTDNANN